MNRSTHPFRSARNRPRRATRATLARTAFALDLATWLDRLSPANRALPSPEVTQPAEPLPPLDVLPSLPEEQGRAAA